MKRFRSSFGLLVIAVVAGVSGVSNVRSARQGQALEPAPQAPPPAAQPYQLENTQQLQQLVAPIALYPDSLVASTLAASRFPEEITEAESWIAARQTLAAAEIAKEADSQTWDPSVKSLLTFPPVLQNMSQNLAWTSELGDAYSNQPNDVMDAIQVMRRDAKKAGKLKSNDQIKVTDKHGYTSIDPKAPQEVYIPQYDPWAVYGYAIDPWPGWVDEPGLWWDGPGLYFGLGFGLGPWLGYGWGWGGWGLDWYNHGIFFNGGPYWGGGPAFFNRYGYYHGNPAFARGGRPGYGASRGFDAPRDGDGLRSGGFSRFGAGGATRGYSARGQQSFGGGFHGGGFGGGGFHGGGGFGGGGFHGGGGCGRR